MSRYICYGCKSEYSTENMVSYCAACFSQEHNGKNIGFCASCQQPTSCFYCLNCQGKSSADESVLSKVMAENRENLERAEKLEKELAEAANERDRWKYDAERTATGTVETEGYWQDRFKKIEAERERLEKELAECKQALSKRTDGY